MVIDYATVIQSGNMALVGFFSVAPFFNFKYSFTLIASLVRWLERLVLNP
jgi:hypothetical protein